MSVINRKDVFRRAISVCLALTMLWGTVFDAAHIHATEVAGEGVSEQVTDASAAESLAGKTISILGASISTYAGTSNGAAAETTNSTIADNAKYYPHSVVTNVTLSDTWWMQAAQDLGLRLLVNNSWSGSSLLYERNGTKGAYVDRCVQLHDDTGDNAGEMPDIIAIQMGTNDFQYYKDTLGTADIDYDTLITENTDGTYTYATPVTSLEAAAIVLHKISVRYPDAEVYYLNISQRVDGTDELIRSFNAELKQVVEHFGAHIVDIYNSAITMEDFDTYIGDGRVHPNCLGMDAYTEAFKKALIAGTAYSVDTHTVSLKLDGVTADYGDDRIVVSGDPFSVDLTAADSLRVTVTMGAEDITATAYAGGTVTIDAVTADVTVTATSVHESREYRWAFDGTDLACVKGGNALTKNGGTTTDGVFSNTRYALETAVVLKHDRPWSVEWKCEGTFQNSGSSSGARIFTSTDVNAEYNARYIFKSNKNGLIAMGEKTATGSHNYGIALGDYDIDWTAEHTYRLENRIADDGSNMVWLYVDSEEIGPMTHYYVGTTDKNTTSDWISGKDFVFPYMGTDTHGFTNASMEYIQVTECEHIYEKGICTGCGAVAAVDITDQFTDWTTGGPVLYATGVGYGENGYTSGSNANLMYSSYISIEDFETLVLTVCARKGNSATGGYAFYTGMGTEYFISEGSSSRNGNGASAEGTVIHTVTVPEDAKYIRVTYWVDSYRSANDLPAFSCVGYTGDCDHSYEAADTAPTCSQQGYTTHTCTLCGLSYIDSYVDTTGHNYSGGVCTVCGTSVLGATWIAPEFAQGDYSMVAIPDPQNLVAYHTDAYYAMMQWIVDNQETHNIQAVMNMGDLTNSNNATQWTTSKTGMDLLTAAGIPWMPMMGNHDDSTWFNQYYPYADYGTDQSWFGGSYEEGKLDHAYWFVTVGDREYMILSLGWAPSWDVLTWAQGIVEAYPQKNVIINCHGYMNSDGTFLSQGDTYSITTYKSGYPEGDDVWAAFQSYENVVLAMGGHIHSQNIVTLVEQNGAGRDVYSLLVDAQNLDISTPVGMVLLLTFHEDSNTVDLNWYSTVYDAMLGQSNRFSIEVPHLCNHVYETVKTAPTCTEQGYTTYTCACGDSYVEGYVDAVGHSWADGVCGECGAAKKSYQRLTYFTVDVQAEDGKTYTDNAVLYLPENYSPNGEPVKLIIYCKQGSSTITSSSNPIESVGFYNYLLSLGYAILGVDGVPDAWRDELGLDETRVVGNPLAVQGTQRAYDYVIENYNIAADGCFISGYSQGGHYAQNVIDLTDIPILAAAEQSPVCSMRYHQWDLSASKTVGGVSFTKAARLNVARIYGFPEVTTNTELLNLAYDASLVDAYDPWVRNSENVYTGFVQSGNLWYLPEGTSLEDITMTKTVKCPVKIWCAEDDAAISSDVMQVFVKAIRNAGGTAEISIAESGGHGFFTKQTAVGTFTENGKTYNTLPIAVEIAQWFAQYGGYTCLHSCQNGICDICGEVQYIPGDITGDGEVNNKDLTRLFKYLTGYDVQVNEAALDVNGDGSVNNKDQTRLFRYLSGWDVEIY